MRKRLLLIYCCLFAVIFISAAANGELIARYDFNGNANDIINRYTGSFYGNAQVATDATRGQVLSLDGNGDYVTCGSNFSSIISGSTKTFMAWAKSDTDNYPTGSTVGGRILSLYREWGYTGYSIYGAGNPATWQGLYAPTPDGYAYFNSSVSVSTNSWTHIALTQNGSAIKIYINGVLANTATNAAIPTLDGPSTAFIGAHRGGSITNFFDGMIDDVRIYNQALSETQINDAMFNNEIPEPATLLLLGLGGLLLRKKK